MKDLKFDTDEETLKYIERRMANKSSQRVGINLPKNKYLALKRLSIIQQTTMNDLINIFCETGLEQANVQLNGDPSKMKW